MYHSEAGNPTISYSGNIATNVCMCVQNLPTVNVTPQTNELSTRLLSASTHL